MLYKSLKEISAKEITGYKVAIKLESNYYSVATMMKYEVGEISYPATDFYGGYHAPYTYENVMLNVTSPLSLLHDVKMRGRTSVFATQEEAQTQLNLWKRLVPEDLQSNFVLLEMTLKKTNDKNLCEGYYSENIKIYAGPYITKIIEL